MTERLKILIVEDDRSLLDLYDLAFPGDIFEKRLVQNGKEALSVYKEWRPEIIVLDILLPKVLGYSVLNEIREAMDDRSTAVIMSTCVDSKGDIEYCEKMGIQGYLVKPFEYKEIAGNVLNMFKSLNRERAELFIDRLKEAA